MPTVSVDRVTYGRFVHDHRTIEVQGARGSSALWLVRTHPEPDLSIGVVTHIDTEQPKLTLNPLRIVDHGTFVSLYLQQALQVYRSWKQARNQEGQHHE